MLELSGRIFCIALVANILVPERADSQQPVPVPNRDNPGAAFAPSGQTTNKQSRAFTARGSDGARIVAFNSVLITAALGSRIEVSTEQTVGPEAPGAIVLLAGGFIATAGSQAVELHFGESALRVARAEVIVARLGQTWIVKVKSEQDAGAIELLPPAETPQTPMEPPASVRLTPENPYVVLDGKLRKADRRESQYLAKINSRLSSEIRPNRAQLKPRDVEDPRDFVVQRVGADSAMVDVELEEIEVDVGCVEICVD